MNVCLVTTWQERCGIAEYAASLVGHAPKDIDFIITRAPFDVEHILFGSAGSQIIHINYEAGLMWNLATASISRLRATGKKLVLTLHNSGSGDNRNDFTREFDRVVVHESTTEGFVHIPQGAVVIPLDPYRNIEDKIGIAGFPFDKKGFHPAAIAAQKLGLGILAIMPDSRHRNPEAMIKVVLQANEDSEVVTGWLTQAEVIEFLSHCVVNCFPYNGNDSGISGAVRFGLAAGRPLVLTRDRQFRDLFDYEDEIYFVNNSLEETIQEAVDGWRGLGAKIPNRVLQDMNWIRTAAMYADLYKELVS